MTITTEDCRKFIVTFQRRNPQIEQARFGGEIDAEALSALANPNNWKRIHKLKPDAETSQHEPVESYQVYRDGQPVNRYAEAQDEINADKIAWERQFNCTPFEGQVSYLILETHEGELLFGNYAGD